VTAVKRLRRSAVHVRFGRPFYLPEGRANTEQLEAYTDQVMLKIAAMLPPQYRGVYADRVRDEG
jgi:1-acyl-sn-glycerol-3-phosphate acyltransferase